LIEKRLFFLPISIDFAALSFPISLAAAVFTFVQIALHPCPDALVDHLRDIEAPLLQQFFLEGPDDAFGPYPIFTLGAPMLSFVHLSSYGINSCYFPSASMTSLHLETWRKVDASQFIAVVSQCPLLEILAIYGDITFPEVTEFTLPCLRSLQLHRDIYYVGTSC